MYPSSARVGDMHKLMINKATRTVAMKHKVKKKQVVVLDDENFQSSKAMYNMGRILVTERNLETFKKMKRTSKKVTVSLKKNLNYKNINAIDLDISNIDVDVLDLMGTWKKNKNIFLNRLQNKMYSDKAIVRLTVCARGEYKSHDDCVSMVINDLKNLKCDYSIKPLKLSQWGVQLKTHGIDPFYKDCECLTTKSNMLNFIFVIKINK
tara:strand:- start:829 stop:1452 length:624 start_codon:yes stop_codon:yes gene_type:complete